MIIKILSVLITCLLGTGLLITSLHADPILVINNNMLAKEIRYEKGVFTIDGETPLKITSKNMTLIITATDSNSTLTQQIKEIKIIEKVSE